MTGNCGGCGDQHGADRTCSACRGSGIKLERDENGKIRKGPNYRPADLGQIIADAMAGGEGEWFEPENPRCKNPGGAARQDRTPTEADLVSVTLAGSGGGGE